MEAGRCRCGCVFFPARPRCSACGRPTRAARPPGTGTLLSFTTVRVPPPGVRRGRVLGVIGFPGGHTVAAKAGRGTDRIGARVALRAVRGRLTYTLLTVDT